MARPQKKRSMPRMRKRAALLLAVHRVGLGVTSRVAPSLAQRWATHLFCKPPRHPHPLVEQAWLKRGERFDVESPVGRVAAWRWGEGERRVLLVHGWGGRGTQLCAFIDPLVAAGFQAVAFDAPAHGFSGSRHATMLHFAKAITAIAQHLGGVYGLIGHSLGAAASNVATAFGWIEAKRVATVAAPIDFDVVARDFAKALNVTDAVRAAMQAQLEQRFGYSWQDVEGGVVAAQNRARALIVHDRSDREVPFAAAERLASQWQGSTLVATQALGHRRILRDPEVIARIVAFMGEP